MLSFWLKIVLTDSSCCRVDLQEVLDRYPKTKKITLIHKNPHLIDSRSYSKLATTLEQKLTGHGVELILGDEHIEDEGFKTGKQEGLIKVRTKGGKVVESECDTAVVLPGEIRDQGLGWRLSLMYAMGIS